MSDEAAAAEAVEETKVEEAQAPDAPPAVETKAKAEAQAEAEPKVEDDWRAKITDEKLRNFASKLASPADAVKVAFDLKQKLSKGIQPPGKDAPEEEVKAFRKAIGAADSVDAYVKAFPEVEGHELNEVDTTVRSKVAEVLHKHNVPVAAVPELQTTMAALAQSVAEEQERVAKEAQEAAQAQLRKEWGKDFDANFNLASRVIRTHASGDFVNFLETTVVNGVKLGDHPEMVRMMGNVGRRMDEHGFIGAVTQDEKQSIQAEIDQLMRDNPPGTEKYKHVAARVSELRTKLFGNGPIVGQGGRAA